MSDGRAEEDAEISLDEAESRLEKELATTLQPSTRSYFRAIWPRLLPFQRQGVAFSVHKQVAFLHILFVHVSHMVTSGLTTLFKQGRACICDEMGLGKTLQAIAVASYYEEDW
jgi:SNF2 family DNA or RNA helicase